jgi:hypothetical protein
MFRNLLNTDLLQRIIMVASRRARAIEKRYFEAGCTQAELRGISLLKGWLSPEQLTQYESYRYFDVIGRQSGKRYRIRYGAGMNIYEIDPRGRMLAGLCLFLASLWSRVMSCWRKRSLWKLTNGVR